MLGDNPFFGVDHLSRERARQSVAQSQNFDNAIKILQYCSNAGANGMVMSTHPKAINFIDRLGQDPGLINKISFFIILPYMQGYVLKINEQGMIKTLIDIINPPNSLRSKFKMVTRGTLVAIRRDFSELFRFFIDAELLRLSNINIKMVFLHDVLTDLALSLNLKTIFETFQEHLHDEYNIEAGLVTKNFPKLTSKLNEWGLKFSTIMTSFNTLGFQMNPSRQLCEHCLPNYDGNIIAMSVLAGGYISPKAAYEYILAQPKIRTVVIGISSIDHARNIFELFLKRKHSSNCYYNST